MDDVRGRNDEAAARVTLESIMGTADAYIDRVLDLLPKETPLRDQIALELRSHIAERLNAGLSEADVLRQLGEPRHLAESYLSPVPLAAASFGQRAAARLIDVALAAALIIPTVCLLFFMVPREYGLFVIGPGIGLGFLGYLAYVILAEAHSGQTVGKRLMGLRVVQESGAQISLGQSVVRQLPVFTQVFWIDVLFALFTERSQRAFELLSKTRVVTAPRNR
jgi:uncharacterized RDD family membrane protein YckC